MKLVFILVSASLFLTGCLKTRNEVKDVEQRQVMQQQVTTLQRSNADVSNRFAELEEEMRNLNGRVDVVENKVGRSDSGFDSALKSSQAQNQELNQKVMILQEALTKMERDMIALNAELQAVKADRASAQAERTSRQAKKNVFEVGEEFFEKKDWKQAILNFQKYRDENPKGGKFAEATYKIGVSFQELAMREEAKTFYDEVVNKFPKSDEARKAKIRLKGMKK
ncbi:tetratricopeptide repeat protein [Bdellovibrio reynosensis]|uniref:Tetratricopeptide repeat protein n=1 Tax=Bdellovibrio reynosensis TaxID=2835041 RepID=A0ABY4C4F5_9BACT|nr:tetratricopeptide repeat protein [Bdellovibrio reynosensis]UOE99846.1 tetratricopeptide repeat protein [Bdellovibrio reynosensis]